jgi:hypothetical protein
MHDVTNITLSHNDNYAQFHMKTSSMVTLSCFMNNIKFKSHCLGPNFYGLPNRTNPSPNMIHHKFTSFMGSF